jgi:nucleotide-binding universal stress UspA family protein
MPSIERILFPVDFSGRCAQTAPLVAAWARHFQAKVTLLHAVAVPAGIADEFSGALYAALQPSIDKAAEERLTAFARQHFASLPVACVVESGGAGEQVAARARKERTSLIMMPTHGHGAFRRCLTGSVASKVLHDAKCPVWTSVHKVSRRVKRAGKVRTILCAVDQDSRAVSLIHWAAWLAAQYDARLKVVHVMAAVDEKSQNRGEKAVRRYWLQRAGAGMAKIMKQAGQPKSELILRGGDVAAMLATTAREQKADLLVAGRGHSMPIVCKSPCPVLSV